jgi:hypothetical protein
VSTDGGDLGPNRGGDRSGGPGGSSSGPNAPQAGPKGWLARKLEKLLEEAANERTIRNNGGTGRSATPPPERNRNRPRPGKRR